MLLKIYKLLILSTVFSIFSFEVSHLHAHEHECEHIKIVNENSSQDLAVSQYNTYFENHDSHHDSHEHLLLLSRIERQNNLILFSDYLNLNILTSKLRIKHQVTLSHFRLKSIRPYDDEHSYIYKNPLHFRSRLLVI